MGCCLSSNNKNRKPEKHQHFQESPNNNRAPPPTLEEETVKEVLSETPISKPTQTQTDKEKDTQMPKLEEHPKEESFINQEEDKTPAETSLASEVYSVSESFSVSTQATVQETKLRDDEAISGNSAVQVGVKRVNRSPARTHRKRPLSGELVPVRERLAKSPARRAEPMRQSRAGMQQQQLQKRNSVRRGVAGEVSGRRSRSPAMRGGARKVQRNESCEKKEEIKNENLQQEGNESIENPHVQLECFIFL